MKKIVLTTEVSQIHMDLIPNDSDCVIIIKKNNDITGAVIKEPGNERWFIRVSGGINTSRNTLREIIEKFSEYEFYVV